MKTIAEMPTSKSHTERELIAAIERGETLWELDAGTSGYDDVLFGDRDNVERIIVSFLNEDRQGDERYTDLPDTWRLHEIDVTKDEDGNYILTGK